LQVGTDFEGAQRPFGVAKVVVCEKGEAPIGDPDESGYESQHSYRFCIENNFLFNEIVNRDGHRWSVKLQA
jgi:hypothetical protein